MPRIFRSVGTGCSTVYELLRSMSRGRFWWLVPLVLFLLPLALVFIFLQTVPLAAPFVYLVF